MHSSKPPAALGIPSNSDFNADHQEGAGLYQVTQKNGSRHSAADAYLRPALHRKNLIVVTNAHVARIILEKQRAVGVEYFSSTGAKTARADREVILSGGSINSPQLLLLSGIGPANEISRAGIRPIHDLPGVGKNLQDHVMISVGYLCTEPVTMATAESLPNLIRYFVLKRGPLVSNVAEAGIFLRTREESQRPDLQLLFGPAYYVNHGLTPRKDHCFGFGPTLITPESRGSISLKSSNPLDPPAIRANYLSTDADMRVIIEGVKLSRRLAQRAATRKIPRRRIAPGRRHPI